MRSSIALALSSSGAIFNASNNVSSLMDGSPCPALGRLPGGWIHPCRCGFCADAGNASDSPSTAPRARMGNRNLMADRVYSPAARQQARIAFNVARAMRRNWADRGVVLSRLRAGGLALAGLEAPVRLIDDVDPPLAPHDAVVPVAATKRFQ